MVSGDWLLVSSEQKQATNQEPTSTIPIESLSQDKLKELIKKISDVRKKKYKRCKDKRYGNLNRAFTEGELRNFFKCCKNIRANLAFRLMAYLGLRVGEVVELKVEDIDFKNHKLKVNTEKSGTTDFLYIHSEVRKILYSWVQKFQEEILKHNGYVLFPDPKCPSKNNHITANWLRKEFRNVSLISNLNESYGIANNYIKEGVLKERRLFRLTTHSLRHYYIDRIYKSCKDPLKTQKLARHQSFKSTQTYIHLRQDDIDKTLRDVFENQGINVKDDEINEFIHFYKLWRGVKQQE